MESTDIARPHGTGTAERAYARAIGWLYLLLGVAGFFTHSLWHMINLSPAMTALHMGIGLAGITLANRGNVRALRIFGVTLGFLLTALGVAGTIDPQTVEPTRMPLENALHVITGIWGFYGSGAAFFGRFRKARPAA